MGHPLGGIPLDLTCGLADLTGHHRADAVLHDAVHHEAQECLEPGGLLNRRASPSLV
jgi:hypothetical protein